MSATVLFPKVGPRRRPVSMSLAAWSVPGLVLAIALLFLPGCRNVEKSEAGGPGKAPVKVALPLDRPDVIEYEDVRGLTKADKSIDLHCRVSGYLKKICFEDGADVTEGQRLFEIDNAPFQAALDSAKADLDVKIANRGFREAELARNKSLPKNAISQSELDKSVAALAEAVAQVSSGTAAVRTADLNLQYTKIDSPVTGRIGKSSISAGNLVVADNTLLSTVVRSDPMLVEFNIDQQIFLDVQGKIREGKLQMADKDNIPVFLKVGKETGYPHRGKLSFANNVFDENTGTILMRAKFDNPKPATGSRLLVPGMDVEVRLPIGDPAQAILVAERAIGADLDQKYVLVLNDKGQPEKRTVKLGPRFEGLQVIEQGLSAADRVIVVGQQNALRPGAKLEIQEVKMGDYAATDATTVPAQTPPAKDSTTSEQPAADKPPEPKAIEIPAGSDSATKPSAENGKPSPEPAKKGE